MRQLRDVLPPGDRFVRRGQFDGRLSLSGVQASSSLRLRRKYRPYGPVYSSHEEVESKLTADQVFTDFREFELWWEAEYESDTTGKVPRPAWLDKGFDLSFLREEK